MHYYIDGYNMLFRVAKEGGSLQPMRERLIQNLNTRILLLNLNVTLVFDAPFQSEGLSRSHKDILEVVYTNQGQTADEYIVDVLTRASRPKNETVVTSDRTLALHVRHLSAKVTSVEEFLDWLNRSYENKLKQTDKPKRKSNLPQLITNQTSASSIVSTGKVSNQLEDYERIFETEYRLLAEKEVLQRSIIKEGMTKKKIKAPRPKKRDPFEAAPDPIDKAKSEMERWQKIFERRSDLY